MKPNNKTSMYLNTEVHYGNGSVQSTDLNEKLIEKEKRNTLVPKDFRHI